MSSKTFPEEEWFTLQEIFDKTNGPFWITKTNWDFTNISRNNPCINDWYGITISGFLTCKISSITLSRNNMYGLLPSSFSNFSGLITINIPSNLLYGSLPSFQNMPFLQVVNLRNNSFSGSISSEMFINTSTVQTLELEYNRLSGTLPDWLYTLSRLKLISLDNNHLSGTLSPQIGNLITLRYLSISNNRFYGTLPTSMVSFRHLNIFSADNNFFSGSVPYIKVTWFSIADNNFDGSIPLLDEPSELRLTSNYFTGTISPTICQIHSLVILSVADNRLTGTIPSCLFRAFRLTTLELDYNMFHGPLSFPNTSSSYLNDVKIEILSFGFNQFSGSFPIEVFYLPKIRAISAPSNCLKGGLNKFICNHQYLSTRLEEPLIYLNLDGLYSPYSCNNHYLFQKTHSFGGSLPACLLSGVEVEVSMTGNGFTGTLPHDHLFSLQKINLSYNYLTGTIPAPSRNVSLHNLDLSYNKLHGQIPKLGFNGSDEEYSIALRNNRFSLNKKDAINLRETSLKIDVLKGNLFRCNDRKLWSSHQTFSSQICQTSFYSDYKLITLLSFTFCISSILYCLRRLVVNNVDIIQSLSYFCIFYLLGVLFDLLPLYYFFQTSNNLKWKFYQESFDWTFSSVYLRGGWISIAVASSLVLLNLLAVFLLQGWKNRLEERSKVKIDLALLLGPNLFAFFLNAIISMSINLYYVKILNTGKGLGLGLSGEMEVLLIQIGLALFNIVWNSVIGPWLSVIMKDESCFEGLLYGRKEVNRVIGSVECIKDTTAAAKICHRRTAFSLPFLYYNTCGWTIITTYLPVWIIVYLFESVANGLMMSLFRYFQIKWRILVHDSMNFNIYLFDSKDDSGIV
eukprot:gene4341-4654_t